MDAIILSVGDELVLGQTVDTNSAYLSARLAAVGCDTVRHVTVGDSQRQIEDAIRDAVDDGPDAIVITGGIGPTDDDLTRQALAGVMKVPLVSDAKWLAHLDAFFQKLGRVMPASNAIQATIPEGATLLWNHHGTAAGIRATLQHKFDRTRPAKPVDVFVMPGVPREMKNMFERDVLPAIESRAAGSAILSRTLHTFGLGESTVAELLGDLMKRDRNPSVGTTVSAGVVSVRINARFATRDDARRELESTTSLCESKLGPLVYGRDDESLAQVVARLLTRDEEPTTIATAESCTGGLIAKYLTDLAGASAFFTQAFVTYSNESKTTQLQVDPRLIEQHGAVSEAVAAAMAENARRLASTDLAVAVTGIAGPDGGSEKKPVGTVCIALASDGATLVRTFTFPGDRDTIRDRSAKTALSMVRFHQLRMPLPF